MADKREKSVLSRRLKKLLIGGLVIVGGTIVYLGVKRYINNLPVQKYSYEWFEGLSKEALDIEREKVRLAFWKAGTDPDTSKASRLQKLLWQFDNELSRRRPKVPEGPRIYREHGWNLYKKD